MSDSGTAAKPAGDSEKGRRPIPLTIFCCLGFVSFPLFLSQRTNEYLKMREIAVHGDAHFQWFFILLLVMIAGYAGLWFMQRWGFWLFLISAMGFGMHNYIGVQNNLEFRNQVIAEQAGDPWPGHKRDTSFLDNPDFVTYQRQELRKAGLEDAIRDAHDAEAQRAPQQLWIVFIIKNLQSFFVVFVGALVFRRMR